MKTIIGFSSFTTSEGTEFMKFYFSDDDVFPDFTGCMCGDVSSPLNMIDFETPDGHVNLGDRLEIVPRISKKGKLYKTLRIF